MAGGIRRNSRESEIEGFRAILLSMQDEDLRARAGGVDERRAAAGLSPLEEHVSRCRREAITARSRPPADPRSKDRDYQIWLRRTGWR